MDLDPRDGRPRARLIGTGLLLVASQLTGPAQTAVWFAALVGDYVGTVLAGAGGWRVNSASHFAERHGLIILIPLGESVVSIGTGVTYLPIVVSGAMMLLFVVERLTIGPPPQDGSEAHLPVE